MKTRHLAQAGVVLMLLAPMGAMVRAEDDQMVEYYVLKGVNDAVDLNYDASIADNTQALAIDPTFWPAYTNRASAKYEKQDYDGAIEDCTRSIELEPQNSVAYDIRASSENAQGAYARAIEDWKKALEFDPSAKTKAKTQPLIDEAQAKLDHS